MIAIKIYFHWKSTLMKYRCYQGDMHPLYRQRIRNALTISNNTILPTKEKQSLKILQKFIKEYNKNQVFI